MNQVAQTIIKVRPRQQAIQDLEQLADGLEKEAKGLRTIAEFLADRQAAKYWQEKEPEIKRLKAQALDFLNE